MIALVLAAQLAIVSQGPDTGTSCTPLAVTVAARASGTVAPRIIVPAVAGVQLLRAAVASRTETDGSGNASTITEGTYVLAIASTGRVTLPPFVAVAGPLRGAARPLVLDVRLPPDAVPLVLVRASLDDGRGRVRDDSLYVGQQVDYVVDVQLNETARRRLRRNPTFFPPEMPAVLAYDLAPPPEVARAGRRCFETLSYRRAIFPLFPGLIVIPPATLTYALPVSSSFFSREESAELRTDTVRLFAVDSPEAGRPADYAGAVGSLRASARIGDTAPRMGDPLVLTVRLEGEGNVKLLPRPAITVDWAAVAPGDERVRVDTSRTRVRGAKEFDWLLTPHRAGRQEIAAVRYPYFDPELGVYAVAATRAIGLDVISATLVRADSATPSRLAIRRTLREEIPPPLPDRPVYWALLALAPLPAITRRVLRVRRRAGTGATAAKRLREAARAGTPPLARELRRLYLDMLHERVRGLSVVTARAPLARQLRRAGVTEATALAAEALLDRLDAAAFSSAGGSDAGLQLDALRLSAAVDAEAVRSPLATTRLTVLLLALLLIGGVALRALPVGVTQTFVDGVHAYDAGNFSLAARQFGRVADRAPRAADAWANLGAAALSAGDSARAVLGWQRALRLDPLDRETRERFVAVRDPVAVASPGFVAPLPASALPIVALALWLAGWSGMAIPPARRSRGLRSMTGGALVVAIIVLAASLQLRHRLDPRDLAVVRGTTSLCASPVSGSVAIAAGAIGEVGRVDAREGSWIRVTLDDARAGWVPASALLPLDAGSSEVAGLTGASHPR